MSWKCYSKTSRRAGFDDYDEYRERKCQICGVDFPIHVHHIIPLSAGGDHCKENVAILCANHHTGYNRLELGGGKLREVDEKEQEELFFCMQTKSNISFSKGNTVIERLGEVGVETLSKYVEIMERRGWSDDYIASKLIRVTEDELQKYKRIIHNENL